VSVPLTGRHIPVHWRRKEITTLTVVYSIVQILYCTDCSAPHSAESLSIPTVSGKPRLCTHERFSGSMDLSVSVSCGVIVSTRTVCPTPLPPHHPSVRRPALKIHQFIQLQGTPEYHRAFVLSRFLTRRWSARPYQHASSGSIPACQQRRTKEVLVACSCRRGSSIRRDGPSPVPTWLDTFRRFTKTHILCVFPMRNPWSRGASASACKC
jgi:hypothetical protein